MGLFKDIYCAECGKKTKILTRISLSDGNYLCSECSKGIPSYMLDTVLKVYTLDDFRGLKNYLNTTNKEYAQKFRETRSFYTLHVDTENRLLYIGNKIEEKTMFLRLADIVEFDLLFSADEYKEGIVHDKVYGKILFQIKYEYPYFYHEEILAKDVKATAKQSFFSTKVEYGNPKDMVEFLTFFLLAQNKAIDEEIGQLENEYGCFDYQVPEYEIGKDNNELVQALGLFMFDSVNDLTMENLRIQRNRLMKAYHPDIGLPEDNKFAQKINNAYEILKKHLEQHK